jgi:hypothetical protein
MAAQSAKRQALKGAGGQWLTKHTRGGKKINQSNHIFRHPRRTSEISTLLPPSIMPHSSAEKRRVYLACRAIFAGNKSHVIA